MVNRRYVRVQSQDMGKMMFDDNVPLLYRLSERAWMQNGLEKYYLYTAIVSSDFLLVYYNTKPKVSYRFCMPHCLDIFTGKESNSFMWNTKGGVLIAAGGEYTNEEELLYMFSCVCHSQTLCNTIYIY